MAIASRYVVGVPHNPGLSVGRYPNAASVGAAPGVVTMPGGVRTLGQIDANGQAVRMPAGTGAATLGGTGGEGGGGNLLASLLLAALGAAPDLYRAGRDLLADPPPHYGPGEDVFEPGSSFMGPGGVSIPNAALGGLGTDWNQVFEPGWSEVPGGAERLLDAPMPPGDQLAGRAGDVAAAGGAAAAGGWGGAIDAAGSFSGAVQAGTLPTDLGLAGSLGSLPGYGDVALNLGNTAGALAGTWMAAQGFKDNRNPNAQLGQQIGSTIGGIAGTLVPIPILGTMAGTALGGAIGGLAGNEMGPPPTIGRNFSSIGTFGGDGQIHWGNSGGDNGAGAADADPFATWFGHDLFRQAAAQGLQFNPAMAGAQFRVGGYDNFSRQMDTPGGYFYTPDAVGGSPENYALRPSDDFWNDAFSPGQASAFSRNVLADMTSRGAFTQAGQQGPGMDFWNSTQGAPLGWYGNEGGNTYGALEYGGTGGFDNVLAGRQNAITGWTNQQQAQGAANNAAQQVLGASFDPFNSYDPNYGWQQMAANMPAGGSQGPVSWQTDPAAMAAQLWGGGALGGGVPVGWNTDGGA